MQAEKGFSRTRLSERIAQTHNNCGSRQTANVKHNKAKSLFLLRITLQRRLPPIRLASRHPYWIGLQLRNEGLGSGPRRLEPYFLLLGSLKSVLQNLLVIDPAIAVTCTATFEVLGSPVLPQGVQRPLQVKWTEV
jgi:hypothetical protein